MRKTLANSSLKPRNTLRTVLAQMAEDAERADRIKDTKKKRPGLKWREVADAANVKERTVLGWAKTGQLSYEHAKALADVAEVDLDWLWRGPAPDLMGAISQPEDQLQAIVLRLDGLEAKLDDLLAFAFERALEGAAGQDAKEDDENGQDAGESAG